MSLFFKCFIYTALLLIYTFNLLSHTIFQPCYPMSNISHEKMPHQKVLKSPTQPFSLLTCLCPYPSTWPCWMIILWASSLMMRPWNHTCVLWITGKKTHTHTISACFFVYIHNHFRFTFPCVVKSVCCQSKWVYLCSGRRGAGGWDCPGHSYAGSASVGKKWPTTHITSSVLLGYCYCCVTAKKKHRHTHIWYEVSSCAPLCLYKLRSQQQISGAAVHWNLLRKVLEGKNKLAQNGRWLMRTLSKKEFTFIYKFLV